MTKTGKTQLQRLEKLLRADKSSTSNTWEVTSETRLPVFAGEVTEEVVSHTHGGYTTDEVLKAGYLVQGWMEAGYTIQRSWVEEEGVVIVKFRNGVIETLVTLRRYA